MRPWQDAHFVKLCDTVDASLALLWISRLRSPDYDLQITIFRLRSPGYKRDLQITSEQSRRQAGKQTCFSLKLCVCGWWSLVWVVERGVGGSMDKNKLYCLKEEFVDVLSSILLYRQAYGLYTTGYCHQKCVELD